MKNQSKKANPGGEANRKQIRSSGFDDGCRLLASSLPRRQVLKFFVSGVASAAVAIVWPQRAWAAKAPHGCCKLSGGCAPASPAGADNKTQRGVCASMGGSFNPGHVCTDDGVCCPPGQVTTVNGKTQCGKKKPKSPSKPKFHDD